MFARCFGQAYLLWSREIMKDIKTIGIVGAGAMGKGIVQIAAQAG